MTDDRQAVIVFMTVFKINSKIKQPLNLLESLLEYPCVRIYVCLYRFFGVLYTKGIQEVLEKTNY